MLNYNLDVSLSVLFADLQLSVSPFIRLQFYVREIQNLTKLYLPLLILMLLLCALSLFLLQT